jgi:uncharacterized cupin superfamily protein
MDIKMPTPACDIEPKLTTSIYPEPFTSMVDGRVKTKLGEYFGLNNFGINFTELAPGAISALKHHHEKQDEFVYVLNGEPTLVMGDDEYKMKPGECVGFPKGSGVGHQLINRSDSPVTYLEVGDRTLGEFVDYPDEDLMAKADAGGVLVFLHKDGAEY